MGSYLIIVRQKEYPLELWTYVVDEDPETWTTREKGENWEIVMVMEVKDKVQRIFFEAWDGTMTKVRI
jgi:hypothetical protein